MQLSLSRSRITIRSILVAVFVLCALTLASFSYIYSQVINLPDELLEIQSSETLTVQAGFNSAKLNTLIHEKSWLETPFYLQMLFKLQPELADIKVGEYQIDPGMTLGDLLKLLNEGRSIQYPFTIVEGSNVAELLAKLASDEKLVHTVTATNAEELASELKLAFPHAEGLFLAETYYFQRGESDKSLLLRANRALNEVLQEQWEKRSDQSVLSSAYEALIMASIVEKETGLPSERPVISGVFNRRLERGMRLQTDPTVIYGLGDTYSGNITRAHLKQKTAYNTYVIKGLPPTPISMVGVEAINAALHPADGNALYFVAKGDGSHQFSETLAQHNAAVKQYQLKRRTDYRSSPEAQ